MPELSSAALDSALSGTEKLLTTDFLYVTLQQAADFSESKSANISSAATTDLSTATAAFVHVTGTTTITALGTAQAGTRRVVVFDDALTLTHHASALILPGGSNITTAAGDVATFVSEGSGNWRCTGYLPASGASLGSGAATVNEESSSYTAVLSDEVVIMDSASANNFTVPPNASVAFPIGAFLEVWQKGSGQTTIVAGSGVTILYHADITLKLKGENSGCSLRKVATNTWRLVGDMEAA